MKFENRVTLSFFKTSPKVQTFPCNLFAWIIREKKNAILLEQTTLILIGWSNIWEMLITEIIISPWMTWEMRILIYHFRMLTIFTNSIRIHQVNSIFVAVSGSNFIHLNHCTFFTRLHLFYLHFKRLLWCMVYG